jgi:hypothetical protein
VFRFAQAIGERVAIVRTAAKVAQKPKAIDSKRAMMCLRVCLEPFTEHEPCQMIVLAQLSLRAAGREGGG